MRFSQSISQSNKFVYRHACVAKRISGAWCRDYYIKTSRVLAVSNDFSTSLNMYACMYVFGAFCGAFWKRKINSPK